MFKKTCLYLLFWSFTLVVSAQQDFSYSSAIDAAKAAKDTTQLNELLLKAKTDNLQDTLALIYHSIGLVNFRTDIQKALAATQQAIAIREQLKDTVELVKSCLNMTFFYKNYADTPQKAKPYYEKIIELGYGPKNKQFFNSLMLLGEMERDEGDYIRAIQHFQLALSYLENPQEEPSIKQKGVFLYLLGSVYNEMLTEKHLKTALSYLQQSSDVLASIEIGQAGLAESYIATGSTYEELHDLNQSITYYQKAKTIFEQEERWDRVVSTSNNLGIVYKKLGQYSDAIDVLKSGLNIRQELYGEGFHPAKAIPTNNLAAVYLAEHDFEKALNLFQEAILHALPNFHSNDIQQNPSKAQLKTEFYNKDMLLTFISDKAMAWLQWYKVEKDVQMLQQGLNALHLSDFLIDQIRFSHSAEESKLVWRQKVHRIYETALETTYLLGNTEQAFYFLEKSKSILLLDALVASDARSIIPEAIANQEKELNKTILDLKQSLAEVSDNQVARKELLDAQKERQELIASLSKTNPRYHELRYTTQVLSLQEAQEQHTSSSHFLLSYFYGDQHVYIMALGPQYKQLFQIARNEELDERLIRLIGQLQDASAILNAPQQYAEDAHYVYTQLMKPVFSVPLNSTPSSLTLVLDGILQYLPFEALLNEQSTSYNLSQLPYLIRKHQISYAYSATILNKQSKRERTLSTTQVLGFAPFAKTKGPLGQLPNSEEELKSIQQLAKGQYTFDQKANSQSFREMAPQHAILHLSTHASANTERGQPCIYFSDQQLFLADLYSMELGTDLVVLSACETGLGKLQTGEGVMSLARGFTFAGAKSLISSLWSVNDRSTARIFTRLYENLRQQQSKSEALYQSKLAYLNSDEVSDFQKSPYYWAGFVHIGGDNTLALDRPNNAYLIYLLGIGLGILLILGTRKFLKSSKIV